MSLVKAPLKPLYAIPLLEIQDVRESEIELFPNQKRSKKLPAIEIVLS